MAATVRLLQIHQNTIRSVLKTQNGLPGITRSVSSACGVSSHSLRVSGVSSHVILQRTLLPAQCQAVSYIPVRYTNFFNKHSADQLWKGVVSVSNQGAKKGRGRGAAKKMSKNLNRGQIIGVGDVNMVWPGLNTPIVRGQEVVSRQLLEPDPDRAKRLRELRDNMGLIRHRTVHPLERGWSGHKLGGRSIGAPDPIGDDKFDGFDSIVLEFKTVSIMTGNLGRKRTASVFTVTGNGDGVAGFALAKALTPRAAIRVSKNKAGQQLVYIERYNERTVMHDFYTQFGITKIFVQKKPEGYGLVCHRAIASICKMVGIKDIYCKVEGSIHIQNLTKAFFLGLIRQKSFQQLSEEKQLHLVELRDENFNYPNVVASPKENPVRTLREIPPNENLDFNLHVMENRVPLVKKKQPPYYTFLPCWQIHLNKYQNSRNKRKVRTELLKEYGFVRSFLFDKYPECHSVYYKDPSLQKDEDDD